MLSVISAERSTLCPNGSPYKRSDSDTVLKCYENDLDACPDSYFCHTGSVEASLTRNGLQDMAEGVCCPRTAEMEPPPVGCPWNTRPLVGQGQRTITCTPGAAHGCPGHAFCHLDSLENRYICCGKDPGSFCAFLQYEVIFRRPKSQMTHFLGRGCPRGSKPMELRGEMVPCLPGDIHKTCPDLATCHRSYLTDHYQCCLSDSGRVSGISSAYFWPENAAHVCRMSWREAACSDRQRHPAALST